MTDLTDRQRECLRFICRHLSQKLRPPTLKEIGAGLRIASTNGVNDHLEALERKGFISIDALASRGILLLKDEDGRRPRIVFEFGGGR